MHLWKISTNKRNAKKIKILIWMLVGLLGVGLTSGCTAPVPEATPQNSVDYAALKSEQTVHLQLYFLSDSDYYSMVTESRSVTVDQDTLWAQVAVDELKNGPQTSGGIACLPEDVTVERVTVSNGLASVTLGGSFAKMDPMSELAARVALTNTLCGLPGIKYVAVYGGAKHADMKLPIVLSRYTGVLKDLLVASQYASDVSRTINIPLYFMDVRGMLLLPEVRECRVRDDDLPSRILEELMCGPLDTQNQLPVLSKSARLAAPPKYTQRANGTASVRINLSAPLSQGLYVAPGYEMLPYAAVANSIMSCMPDVTGVSFEVNGTRVVRVGVTDLGSSGVITRDAARTYEGQSITLYFPNEQMDTLIPVKRAVPVSDTVQSIKWMEELLKGPLDRENDHLWPIFPNGITAKDVLHLKISEDLAILDISKNFADIVAAKKFSLSRESMLVYSIINTLTGKNGVKRVQFLVEGKQTDSLGGSISIQGPLLRNTGIIQ